MLKVLRRLKEQPKAKWEFYELSYDGLPGGFEREANWAVRYKRRNSDPKQKYEYKVEVANE